MITLYMTQKNDPTIIPEGVFSTETGVITLEISLGTYSLTGKTITAVFSQTAVETAPLTVSGGLIQLPITLGLLVAGENQIQLNIREGLTLEQSPIMKWTVGLAVAGTDPAPTGVDIITYLLADYVNVKHEGIKGDGSDETTAMQDALDKAVNANGVFYVPKNMTVTVDSLTIANKSKFKLQIDGTLKRKASGSSIGMLIITGSTDFEVDTYHADGNVANNGVTLNEQQHLLVIGTSVDFRLGKIIGKDSGGDVVYISGCTKLQSDSIVGYGEDTGRNTLSIIKGEYMQFSKITSIGVGTETMPGGVDCEPNSATDYIRNIQFGNVYVEGRATGAFSLSNNFGADCQNVTVDSLIINRRSKIASISTRMGLWVKQFNDVKIKGIIKELQTDISLLASTGIYIDGGDNLDLDLDISNMVKGGSIGFGTNTNNLKLKGTIKNILQEGLELVFISNSTIDSVIQDCSSNGGSFWNLKFGTGCVLANVTIKGAVKKVTTGFRAITVAGTVDCNFDNCDLSGWIKGVEQVSGVYTGVTNLSFKNCKNYNYNGGVPNYGYWMPADYVLQNTPVIAGTAPNKYVVHGWRRITQGTSGTLNTDWVEDRALTGI